MKYAVISDIHANLEALEAVFNDIDSNNIDEVICLGDIVGYGANPNECIELITKRCPITIQGNHDAAAVEILSTQHFNIHAKIAIEWTTKELKQTGRDYLLSLPTKKILDTFTLVHATPYEPNMWYYITSLEEAAFNFQFFPTPVCFVGHTHIPMIIVMSSEEEIFVHQKSEILLGEDENNRILVNVGSVGQPRDRNPHASYGVFDTETMEFSFRRVQYDIDKTQAKMRKIKMPEFLINRLSEGR